MNLLYQIIDPLVPVHVLENQEFIWIKNTLKSNFEIKHVPIPQYIQRCLFSDMSPSNRLQYMVFSEKYILKLFEILFLIEHFRTS